MRVSVGYVSKVVKNYENNISFPPMRKLPARDVVTEDLMEYIESEKLCKPSMYTKEIQQRLLLDGVSPPNHLPSQSARKKCIQNDCKMTKKKISQVPTETLSRANREYTDYFLAEIAQLDCTAVIVTSGNRSYGNSYLGERAIEFQRYASNASHTLNLLHSIHGEDYYNILRGPSNGMELLNFFDEALAVDRADGTTILENGDLVVMDYCGFHHGNFVEPSLRDILE